MRAYPSAYRRERGDEWIGTLAEAATPDQRLPSLRESLALAVRGLQTRGPPRLAWFAPASFFIAVANSLMGPCAVVVCSVVGALVGDVIEFLGCRAAFRSGRRRWGEDGRCCVEDRVEDLAGEVYSCVVVLWATGSAASRPASSTTWTAWGALPDEATLVRVAVYLPSNNELIALATDLAAPPATLPRADVSAPEARAASVRAGVLGLATHNLPLVRRFVPTIEEVLSARFVAPFGYALTFRGGDDRVAQLLALMPGQWRPDWTLRVYGPNAALHVRFPPS